MSLSEFKDHLHSKKAKGNVFKDEKGFWYAPLELPFSDFNKEINLPMTNKHYPDGAVGIRVDDGFWAVAALSYEFKDMTIQEIVAIMWPHYVDEAEYGSDEVAEYGDKNA